LTTTAVARRYLVHDALDPGGGNLMKITEKMTILEVLKAAPQTRKVFDRFAMRCRSCQGVAAETVAAGARNHGVDPKALLRELNEAAKADK
jgi:hybrid cluster-associated redox disulfide protein